MAKHFLSFFKIFFSISVIAFVVVMMYTNLVDLELNEKIGSGIFYLKGYYEEGNEIVFEQGIGVITIPVVAGFVVSLFMEILQFSFKKRVI